jgi:hypothetical protein
VLTLIWIAAMSWMLWDELPIVGRSAPQTSISPLAKFREQYPEYGGLTDVHLADMLYKRFYSDMTRGKFDDQLYSKFYSDMPRAEFDAKFGLGRFFSNDLPDAPWASNDLPDAPWAKAEPKNLSDDQRPDPLFLRLSGGHSDRFSWGPLLVTLLPPCIVLCERYALAMEPELPSTGQFLDRPRCGKRRGEAFTNEKPEDNKPSR